MRQTSRSIAEIRQALKGHQKRLQLGDSIDSISELAKEAGLHRDTLYAAIAGDRISEVSQIRLSKMLDRINEQQPSFSRLMNISISSNGPKIGFGLNQNNILRPK